MMPATTASTSFISTTSPYKLTNGDAELHENGESRSFWSSRVSVAQRVSELRNRYAHSFRPTSTNPEPRNVPNLCTGSSVAAIKLRLFSHGLNIDSIPLVKPRTNRYQEYLQLKGPPQSTLDNIWFQNNVISNIFRPFGVRDLLSCSTVCKKWLEVLASSSFMSRLRVVISFKEMESIETRIRMAYKRRIQAIRLVYMTNAHMQEFTNTFIATFREFFPECCVNSQLSCDSSQLSDLAADAIGTFQSAPELIKRSSIFNVKFHSCANSEACSIMTEVSYDSIFDASVASSIEKHGNLQPALQVPHSRNFTTSFNYRHISSLAIDNCSLSDKSLEQLVCGLHTVNHLAISGCNDLSEIGLWVCLRPWMTHLSVQDCINFSDDSLSAVVQLMPNLQEFSLQAYHVTDVGLAYLTANHFGVHLRSLFLPNCLEVTDEGLANLAQHLPNLQRLGLPGCCKLSDFGAEAICEGLKHLIFLDLSNNPRVTDVSLECIACDLFFLETLNLDRCLNITENGIRHISTLPKLQILTLRWCCGLSDDALFHLPSLTTLRFLSIAGCRQFSADGLTALTCFEDLRRLEVTNSSASLPATKSYLQNQLRYCTILN